VSGAYPVLTGNAPLSPIARVATGIWGLNLQQSNNLLPSQWATQADNMVFNSEGILASRYGWGSPLNTTPMSGSPIVKTIFEYVPISGSNSVISTGGNSIYAGTTSLTNITGTLTPTADNWKFVNFNGLCYGLQSGHPLIQYTGTGNFTAVSAASGSVPNGNELLSAFGRLWGSDSTGQVLKYCNLLDATNWNITGAGSINLTSVWGTGNDSIVALAAFNNFLIIFGSKNIIIYTSSTASPIGLDPTGIYVYDIIPGVGCIARDSVQNVNGTDLVFLSQFGVTSLQRLLIERSNPIRQISNNVRDALLLIAQTEPIGNIKSSFDPYAGLYIISFPSSQYIFVFDTKVNLQDGTWRITKWNNFYPTALYTLHDGKTLLAGKAGQLYQYGDQLNVTQDNSSSYTSSYSSCWFDLGDELNTRLKVLKRIEAIVAIQGSGSANLRWQWDFSGSWNNTSINWNTGLPAQFGIGEFGIDGFGGGTQGTNLEIPASGTGQYLQVGVDFQVNGTPVVLQQMEIYCKIGRTV